MKLKEDLTTDLKTKMSTEFGKSGGGGVDRLIVQNGFINSLGENKGKNKKEQVIKRKIKQGVSDKIVGTPKLDKPIGKMYSSIGGESKESTGSGSAGGYSAPLFSVTKKEMDEMKQSSFKSPKLTMFSDEAPKSMKDMNEPCWKGYKQNGMKDKNGKQVPNCVPIKESEEVEEKWSKNYKDSIDCNNPKGFSQRAHCQGKKKKNMSEEKLKGGKSDNKTLLDIAKKHDPKGYYHPSNFIDSLKKQLNKGMKVEMEHTKDNEKAKEIAMDHLFEDPKYYDKLEKIEGKKTETKEATGASSSGQYSTPAAWAKSTSKKDWRGKSKTQIPGGKFVQVKEKCKKFPYCNQGDIKALNIFENETFKRVVKNISEKHGISENVIKSILSYEYYNVK